MKTNEYRFPPVELLAAPEKTDDGNIREEAGQTAKKLIDILTEYGIEASVSDIRRGSAVTRYMLKPAPDAEISKITSLKNDIALRMGIPSIRFDTPRPGNAAIGVEIPNRTRETVYLRELIDSEPFRCAESPLAVVLGRDVEGNIVIADLAKMPHLIIAGSTGTGKSVCVHSILISLIYKNSPEDVRLILADPKGVELNEYNGLPHLLVPVLYDGEKGAGALLWAACLEKSRRYELLTKNNVSDIDEYNELAGKKEGMAKLPRIVMIIDEMADISYVSPMKVNEAVKRLAISGRRVGIHLIISTQRPTADVLPEGFKCNIPGRIAFAVASAEDSITILDEDGAENLIGMGDMLFKRLGGNARRIQGCYVSDEEVMNITGFVKRGGMADYDETAGPEIERLAAGLKE